MGNLYVFLLIGLVLQMTLLVSASRFELGKDQAAEFLRNDNAVQKRFIYTAKEQRREAKENYEEKCERSAFSKMFKKPRWCPELSLWPEWVQITHDDGNRNSNQYELMK